MSFAQRMVPSPLRVNCWFVFPAKHSQIWSLVPSTWVLDFVVENGRGRRTIVSTVGYVQAEVIADGDGGFGTGSITRSAFGYCPCTVRGRDGVAGLDVDFSAVFQASFDGDAVTDVVDGVL